jgi:hypothetical protein
MDLYFATLNGLVNYPFDGVKRMYMPFGEEKLCEKATGSLRISL